MSSFRWVSILLLLVPGALPAAAQPPTYEVEDLGLLTEYGTYATALNGAGQVTGHIIVAPFGVHVGAEPKAFIYSGGALTALDPADEFWGSRALDINDEGQVVGYVQYVADGYTSPFLHEGGGGIVILNPFDVPPFANTGMAFGVSSEGQVVGTAQSSAFLITPPSPSGTAIAYGSAVAVSDLGLVVGTFKPLPFSSEEHGFAYENGVLQNLDDLRLGLGETGTSFEPSAVNLSGDIVGTVSGPEVDTQATVLAFGVVGWPWTDLGVLDGAARSHGNGINERGDVVGTLDPDTPGDPKRAFLYHDGEMHDLNDLLAGNPGLFLTEGMDINDAGQIVARGFDLDDTDTPRSYLLTPADPATLIEDLADFIRGLGLPHGLENALLVKLQNALEELETGALSEACGLLGAFVNQVEAQSDKKISGEDAVEAVQKATDIREMLGCL